MILEPGDPEASVLIESIGPDAEPRMPYKLPPLSRRARSRRSRTGSSKGRSSTGRRSRRRSIASLVDPLAGPARVALKGPAADPVTSLAFSPDGSTLAAAVGREVVLFDADDGQARRARSATIPGPLNPSGSPPTARRSIAAGGRAGCSARSRSGTSPAAGSSAEVAAHADTILAADLSPDGKTLATAGYDRLVMLWDLGHAEADPDAQGPHRRRSTPSPSRRTARRSRRRAPTGRSSSGTSRRARARQTLSDATAELYAVAFGRRRLDRLRGGRRPLDPRLASRGARSASLVGSAFAHDGRAPARRLARRQDARLQRRGPRRQALGPRHAHPADVAPRAARLAPGPRAQPATASRLAVGRYDGSLAVYDPSTGKPVLDVLRDAGAPPPPRRSPSSTGTRRSIRRHPGRCAGGRSPAHLTGNGVGRATAVVFPEPGLTAEIVPAAKPDPNRLEVDLTIAPDARVGLHRFGVVTPLGVPGFQCSRSRPSPRPPRSSRTTTRARSSLSRSPPRSSARSTGRATSTISGSRSRPGRRSSSR